MLKKLFCLLTVSLFMLHTFAQPVRVAVAANAQFVVNRLAKEFKKSSGIDVEVISGASGKLAAQIRNGAPYDLFLSADMAFAQELFKDGNGLMKPRIYARGSLIVCTTTNADLKSWKTLILSKSGGKIAVANPKVAPYGKAAEEALHYYGLTDAAANRLVFAESISQVNTYVLTRAVSFGFSTESFVYELNPIGNFRWQKVDPAAYAPIEQGAVLLKYSKTRNYVKSKRFYDYLFSAAAKTIFKQFGYTTV